MALGSFLATVIASVTAFAPQSFVRRSVTSLSVAVDPTTVSKKEFEDICGLHFTEEEMTLRLQRTSYLYPKHVEVIEDIAPIADEMVNDIVSHFTLFLTHFSGLLCSSFDHDHRCAQMEAK